MIRQILRKLQDKDNRILLKRLSILVILVIVLDTVYFSFLSEIIGGASYGRWHWTSAITPYDITLVIISLLCIGELVITICCCERLSFVLSVRCILLVIGKNLMSFSYMLYKWWESVQTNYDDFFIYDHLLDLRTFNISMAYLCLGIPSTLLLFRFMKNHTKDQNILFKNLAIFNLTVSLLFFIIERILCQGYYT